MSMIAVNNLSDIFIYYVSSVFIEETLVNEQSFNILQILWLNILKILLEYAEKGNALELHHLVVCVSDNIKRVIEFLI